MLDDFDITYSILRMFSKFANVLKNALLPEFRTDNVDIKKSSNN